MNESEYTVCLEDDRAYDILLSPAEKCQKYKIQSCDCCDDMNCGDNISEAKRRIVKLEAEMKRKDKIFQDVLDAHICRSAIRDSMRKKYRGQNDGRK